MVIKSRAAPALVATALVLVVLLSLWFTAWVAFGPMSAEIEHSRDMLLNKVDHASTLSASRILMSTLSGETLFAQDPRVPEPIAKLKPQYVVIKTDRVWIECGGGFHHQGFIAFSENAGGKPYAGSTGTQKIIDGLWFYEDTE